MFQSTPLREGRHASKCGIHTLQSFNPRPYGRGDVEPVARAPIIPCFNPRPYGRGDKRGHIPIEGGKQVSIHAPTGGATSENETMSCYIFVSIHAPTGGATGDLNFLSPYMTVSIHAPTGGATESVSDVGFIRQFQSTPLREGRLCVTCEKLRPKRFQSTPLREGRLHNVKIVKVNK